MSFGDVSYFPEDDDGTMAIVDGLARRLGSDARADTVFGDAVTHGDVTVIPVAQVNWAIGGGSGSGGDDTPEGDDFGEGRGGAAAVSARPLGYIEIRPWGTQFHATHDRGGVWLRVAAAGFAVWMCLRAVRDLRR
jgi:uncharacterized spore protein YtfJ